MSIRAETIAVAALCMCIALGLAVWVASHGLRWAAILDLVAVAYFVREGVIAYQRQ